jgi:hypothetical protein
MKKLLVALCLGALSLYFVPMEVVPANGDRFSYEDPVGWKVILNGRIREDKAREITNMARGSDVGKLFKLVVSKPGDYLEFLIFPNGHSLIWTPKTIIVLELKEDGSQVKPEAVYFIESPLQQTLYDASKRAIPINHDIASKDRGFAVFVKFPWGSTRSKLGGFKVSNMLVVDPQAGATLVRGGE